MTLHTLSAVIRNHPMISDDVITLPGSGVSMPLMGLGTWAWGDTSTWGMNGYDRSYDLATIREAFARSIAGGVTLLDTAEAYGKGESERIIGRLLAEDAGARARVGVSNYSERELHAIHRALADRGIALATNQVEFSLLRMLPERSGLLGACREMGVTVLAYSPIGQGRLTGKYSGANPPPGQRNFSAYPMTEIEPILAELARCGARHGGKTPSQVALNWLICKGTVPIPGAKTGAQAEQNAGAFGWRLSADEVAALDRVAKPGQRRLFHRIWQHG